MASEKVLEVLVHRHVFDSDRPFSAVLDGIFGGISRPDIEALFAQLAASTSYGQFSSLVRQAQGSAGLMQFLLLDLRCRTAEPVSLATHSPARSIPITMRPPRKSRSVSTPRCLTCCVM